MEIEVFRPTLWSQFGAAIDMIEEAVASCPDDLWSRAGPAPRFWYTAFHALFWLDRYLSERADDAPPPPFESTELDPHDTKPERAYTRGELLAYAAHCREKCICALETLTDQKALERCAFKRLNMTVLELHLYNLRHAQHHAGQLALLLRQETDRGLAWVAKSRS